MRSTSHKTSASTDVGTVIRRNRLGEITASSCCRMFSQFNSRLAVLPACEVRVIDTTSQRFEYKQASLKSASKIDTPVKFPLQLNMLPYTTRGRTADIKDSQEMARSCTYDLLSVVVHVGEIDTGKSVASPVAIVHRSNSTQATTSHTAEWATSGSLSTTTASSWRANPRC